MWFWQRRKVLERRALDFTPTAGISLSGLWTIVEETTAGVIQLGAKIDQQGVSVKGSVQGKFAQLCPISFSGLIIDRELIATWWRPHAVGIGSGVLRLLISDDTHVLKGTGTWWAEGQSVMESHQFHWQRVG